MKLQEWINLTGIKKAQLAKMLGVSSQQLTRILKYGQPPRPDEMVKLYWISFGAVRPDDFYDIASVPVELQYLLEPKTRRKKYVALEEINALLKRKRNRWKRSALDH